MATSAVVVGITPQHSLTYWAYSIDQNGVYTETGRPVRPKISKGLKAALIAQPSTTPGGSKILYWSTYDGLRSMIKVGNGTGFPVYADSIFQPYTIQYVSPPPGEPSDTSTAKPSSARGLETLAKNMARIITGSILRTVDTITNPIESTVSNLQSFAANPSEFIKSSPLMSAAKALDDFLRSTGVTPNPATYPVEEVYCLPGENLGDLSPYGGNPVFGDDSGGSAPASNTGSESKDQTLERVLGVLSKLIDTFKTTPDNDRQPGSSIWDKLLGVLNLLGDVDGIFSKALKVPLQIPQAILDVADMLDAISTFLEPLLTAIGQSLGDKDDSTDTTNSDLVKALIGDSDSSILAGLIDEDLSLHQAITDYAEWSQEQEQPAYLNAWFSCAELFDPQD